MRKPALSRNQNGTLIHTEWNIHVPETLYHALADCDFVKDIVVSCISTLGVITRPPNENNSPEHSVLWSFDDKVLGPCQPQITKCTLTNTLRWLISLAILNFCREKTKPYAIIIVNNVKKVLIRLSKKNHRIPIFLELKNRAISDFSHLTRPPENP